MTGQAVNKTGKRLAACPKIQRSTTHVRVKWPVKFELEKWMRRHHCKTHSQAIKKLLEGERL